MALDTLKVAPSAPETTSRTSIVRKEHVTRNWKRSCSYIRTKAIHPRGQAGRKTSTDIADINQLWRLSAAIAWALGSHVFYRTVTSASRTIALSLGYPRCHSERRACPAL